MTRQQAFEFMAFAIGLVGGGYHPDNSFADYIDKDDKSSFTDEQVKKYDALQEQAKAVFGDDIYSVGMHYMDTFLDP